MNASAYLLLRLSGKLECMIHFTVYFLTPFHKRIKIDLLTIFKLC